MVGLALLTPWSAYQRFADPPGDRLLKWQLGGSLEIDERGALGTIIDGYRAAGFDGTLANKWGNVTRMVGQRDMEGAIRVASDEIGAGHYGRALSALRLPRFFSLLPFLGILLFAPVAMLFARVRGRPDGPEWRFALASFAFCGLASAFWALLMFDEPDSSTMIHVGSLVVPLLAVCGCVVGMYAVFPRLAIGLVGLNVLIVLLLYAPALSPPPGTGYSTAAALLAAFSLAGFALVAFRQVSAH